jgi:hypothetical protein
VGGRVEGATRGAVARGRRAARARRAAARAARRRGRCRRRRVVPLLRLDRLFVCRTVVGLVIRRCRCCCHRRRCRRRCRRARREIRAARIGRNNRRRCICRRSCEAQNVR